METGSFASFGRYEWIRILFPGFFFTLLSGLFFYGFINRYIGFAPDPLEAILLFAGLTLTSGLMMYARETPKRRKAFQENQPSKYLSARARTMKDMELLDDAQSRQLYFYILNNHIPPLFHEKIFFFGTIYSIMVQIRRTLFWFAVIGTAALGFQISKGFTLADQQGLLVFTLAVWLLYLMNIRYNKADRKMQENYQDQIFWLQMNNDLVETILRRWRSSHRL
ncbi:MAG: hypothetical protein HY563_03845 [Ignavibacteriales bacterium]|nr:hypothetical protein [Ignavibacteriales bacterium]